jgi:hypothetical protein
MYKADYRKSAIAVIAGQTVERAARHLRIRRPMGVFAANHEMPAAAGRAGKRSTYPI